VKLTAKIFYNVIATGVNVIGGFVRNKIFAFYLSITLFGILSITQQSASLLFTFFAFGMPLAFSTIGSQLVNQSFENQKEIISKMVVFILLIGLGTGIVIAGILSFQINQVVHIITNNYFYASITAILLFSVPFMVIQNSLFSILEGRGMVKETVYFKVIPTIVGLPILFWLVYKFQLTGAAIGLFINESLLVITGLYLLRRWIKFDYESLRINLILPSVFKIAFLSVIVGVGWLGIDFIVKRYILGTFGELENGIVQSVGKITDLYPNIALSWLTVHLFPEVAKNQNNKTELCRIIEQTMLFAVVLVVPIILILFAFRGTVIEILYKHDFIVSVNFFGAMLTVGIPKVMAWVIGLPLMPLGLKRQWFYASLFFMLGYVISIWLGMKLGFGIYSIPIAYIISSVIQIVYVLGVYRYHQFEYAKSFYSQLGLFGLIFGIFVLAVFYVGVLWFVCILFLWMIWRYRFILEIKEKLYAYLQQ
jgi:PST family polysaccharide transporter